MVPAGAGSLSWRRSAGRRGSSTSTFGLGAVLRGWSTTALSDASSWRGPARWFGAFRRRPARRRGPRRQRRLGGSCGTGTDGEGLVGTATCGELRLAHFASSDRQRLPTTLVDGAGAPTISEPR